MKKLTLAFAAMLMVLASCTNNQLTTIVSTEYGKVECYIQDSLKIFKGIPFAAPPVGD